MMKAIKDSRGKPKELVERLNQLNREVLRTNDLDNGIWIEQTVASISQDPANYAGFEAEFVQVQELKQVLQEKFITIRKMGNNPEYITYLWLCKIRSRNSFLAILEFLSLSRPSFRPLLGLLKKGGLQFYA